MRSECGEHARRQKANREIAIGEANEFARGRRLADCAACAIGGDNVYAAFGFTGRTFHKRAEPGEAIGSGGISNAARRHKRDIFGAMR